MRLAKQLKRLDWDLFRNLCFLWGLEYSHMPTAPHSLLTLIKEMPIAEHLVNPPADTRARPSTGIWAGTVLQQVREK